MVRLLLSFALLINVTTAFSQTRADTNFAFGGATTNTQNATDLFQPSLGEAVRAVGLELVGLSQQLAFAEAVIADVDATRDVFWLWAGTNNILAGSITGNPDPSQAPIELKAALVKLYEDMGARIFVVPNLMLLGNLPQFNTNPDTQNGINALTTGQNALLAQALSEFSAEYPSATVIPLDVQSLFLQLAASGEFTNTNEACFTTGLPNGLPCSDYLYADDIHFTSAAAAKIAELAAAQLSSIDVRRIITIGDSFSDTGAFFNTTARALGQGFPPPPFFEGRFSDGLNVIDQLESLLAVTVPSSAFVQPSSMALQSGANSFDAPVDLIIPKRLTMTNESYFGLVFLSFGNQGYCIYFPDGISDGKRQLTACSYGLNAGQTVNVDTVSLIAPFSPGEVSLDIFFYQN